MAYGAYSANTIQLGRESTPGTAVAATSIWRGPAASIEDARTRQVAEEQVGLLIPTARIYDSALGAKLAMPATELTFEQVLHILEAGIVAATPAGPSPYTYTYALPQTATPNTIKTYTIESGNTVAGDGAEMEQSFVEEFELSGQRLAPWMMSATWMGRQRSVATLTSPLSLVAVEEAQFGKTKLYIDATGGTIGSTQKTGVLTKASVKVRTGWQAVYAGDGVLYYTNVKYVRPEVRLALTIELESGGVATTERAAFVAKSLRLVRLDCAGSTSDRNLTIDGSFIWDTVGDYENDNGDTVLTLEGQAWYSSADNQYFSVVVKNLVSTVP